jgi:hypothetical protein
MKRCAWRREQACGFTYLGYDVTNQDSQIKNTKRSKRHGNSTTL